MNFRIILLACSCLLLIVISPIRSPLISMVKGADNINRLLSYHDQKLYKDLFIIQNEGRWQEADQLISQLENPILLGHLQFQRYMHPTAYRSSYQELYQWLLDYGDHPGAIRIQKLAARRRGAGDEPVPPLKSRDITAKWQRVVMTRKAQPPADWQERNIRYSANALKERRKLQAMVQDGYVTIALKRLDEETGHLFSKSAKADLMGLFARGYYRYHKDDLVIKMALRSAKLDPYATEANWWAGLAAWRGGAYEKSAGFFNAMANAEQAIAPPLNERLEAAAFWGSRAWLRAKKPENIRPLLMKISPKTRSFYGLLGLYASARTPQFDWQDNKDKPFDIADEDYQSLLENKAIYRSLALRQIEKYDLALAEIDGVYKALSLDGLGKLLDISDHYGLANLSYRIGLHLTYRGHKMPDQASFPLPFWQPHHGLDIDKALIYSFIRQESRFLPLAGSRAGASGVMQLLPSTARYIASLTGMDRQAELTNPSENMALGEQYIRYLMANSNIEGNLFFVTVGYNAGPGNLQSWREAFDYNGDPLLFIETLPSRETRNYVEKIMANLWIYRYRLNQQTPSMHDLMGGGWPIYVDLEPRRIQIEQN